MSLADELSEEAVKSPYGMRCPIARALTALDPEDAAVLHEAVNSPHIYTSVQIANVLARRGLAVKPPAVGRHRRGGCACEPVG